MGLGPLGEGLPRPYKSEIHTLWKLNYSLTDPQPQNWTQFQKIRKSKHFDDDGILEWNQINLTKKNLKKSINQ
jgi:hypothetical protein